MKKLIFLIFFFPLFVFSQTPDSLDLNEVEEYELSNEWDNLEDVFSYVNFNRDILTTSNLSVGFVGRNFSTSLTLNYRRNMSTKKWISDYNLYLNPFFNYYSFGYGLIKSDDKRTTSFKINTSTGFDGDYGFNFSYADIFRTKKYGTIGYGIFTNSNFFGTYLDYKDGNLKLNPASSNTDLNFLLTYSFPFDVKKLEIVPEFYLFKTVYSIYKEENIIQPYRPDGNIDLYYGTTINYSITPKFTLNLSIRGNYRYDKFEINNLIYKEKPLLFNIGTELPF